MFPAPRSWLLPALLVACTSGKPGETGDTDPVDTDVDTGDSGPVDPEPVWESFPVQTASTLNGVYVDGTTVYAAGTLGEAWSGGADGWTDLAPPLDDNDVGDLWGSGTGEGVILVAPAASGLVGRWSTGAWEVEDLGTSTFDGVGGSNANAVFVVGWGGIYYSDGVSWTFETAPGYPQLNDIFAVNSDAVAVGEGGAAAVRRDGAWESTASGTTVRLNGVSGVAPDDAWAVGMDGVVLRWDGTAWTAVESGTTEALWAVHALSESEVYVVGNRGVALRWNGAAFEDLPTGVANNLYGVYAASAGNVWAVGNRGAAIRLSE